MKRAIFFILLIAGMGAASYLLLFQCDFLDVLKNAFELVKKGDWKWSEFNAFTVQIYGVTAFLFIVGVLFLALLIMALTTLFRFDRIHRFYATASWYLFAAILFTGAVVYVILQGDIEFMDALKDMPWEYYVPIGSALVLNIVGFILKKTERKDY